MKRIVCKMLVAATLAALGLTAAQAGPPTGADREAVPKMIVADSAARADHPPAPEVWSMCVEYRTRRGPQYPWGAWRHYVTITGDYDTALAQANDAADDIEGLSKNYQARIIKSRIR
jgi:hypothetical protein